jgi:hypothetical protein
LDEFLMDKYVIDVPFLLRALLVRGIILQTRPKKTPSIKQVNEGTSPSHQLKLETSSFVIEVMFFFPFVPATCYGIYTTILELAEDHRKSQK